jgi:hypothetical protein
MTSVSRQTRVPFGTSFINLPSNKQSPTLALKPTKQNPGRKSNPKNRKAAPDVDEACSRDHSVVSSQEKIPSQPTLAALPTIIEEKENRLNDPHTVPINGASSSRSFDHRSNGFASRKSFQRSASITSEDIIYSTSLSYSSSPSSASGSSAFSLDSEPSVGHAFSGPPLDAITVVPSSGLTEMEERRIIESHGLSQSLEDEGDADDEEDFDAIIGRGVIVPAPMFLPEPSIVSKRDKDPIKLVKPAEEDEEVQPTEIPDWPCPISKSLSTRSREAQLARIYETRPVTPSLLSFTDDTPRAMRRRVHLKRTWQARYGPMEPDALRKASYERSRLLRSGLRFLPAFPPMPHEQNVLLFPRAGNLHQLHSPESNGSLEDYALGYVDLSFIRKSLYAFDLRMRTGTDLWSDDEVDVHNLFGDNRQWEMDWNIRWRVAYWLLQDEDDDEEYDEGEESQEE